jgi:hypothetical protein
MFEWLFLLLAPVAPAAPETPKTYYVGRLSAEVAYVGLQPQKAVDNRVDREDCTVCKGTGQVRSGDGQGWTKCSNCKPPPEQLKAGDPAAAVPPSMRLQSKPLQTPEKCEDGKCPAPAR